jgi:acyl dehydratase
MAVNPDFAGRTYPPSGPYAVDAALIAAFAAAVGAGDPVHTDASAARDAGYGDVIAPPTMAVRFSQQSERAYITDPGQPLTSAAWSTANSGSSTTVPSPLATRSSASRRWMPSARLVATR